MKLMHKAVLLLGLISSASALAQTFSLDAYERKDYSAAFDGFKKCAERDCNPNAYYWLGQMYESGRGTYTDKQKAAFWYRKAAEKGEARSQASLAVLYATGDGVPKDRQTAYFWLLLAASDSPNLYGTWRDSVETILTPQERVNAQAEAGVWKEK